jgi:D-tyrosyl-tRNA(Tyr) deacylase
MKALLQRVSEAEVSVERKTVSKIARGMLVFLGVERGDAHEDAEYLASKLARLRIFEDGEGKMNLSLLDTKGEMLAISQFTLAAELKKGNRPSFDRAESPERARALFEHFCSRVREQGVPVKEGVFGAMMEVRLVNDGPVTFMVESKR